MLLSSTRLKIGDCFVDFASGELRHGEQSIVMEARLARLLMHLAHRPGEIVSVDELLDQVWSGVVVSQDSVYQAITALRKALGDDPKSPSYIVTIPRRGYKLIAPVSNEDIRSSPLPEPVTAAPAKGSFSRRRLAIAGTMFAVAAAIAGYATMHRAGPVTAARPVLAKQSIVVLPFLDETDTMTEEPFADGMVEELINKLTKMPNLAVAPAADSFFYKDKQVSTSDVAAALHVTFVLEGSVRKSGDTLRVTVRLTRATDHFVVWSETYDRPWHDKLMIQDDIADEVSRSLAKSIN